MVLGLTRHLSHSVHNQAWGNSFGSGRQVLGQSGVAGFPTSGREDGLEGPFGSHWRWVLFLSYQETAAVGSD